MNTRIENNFLIKSEIHAEKSLASFEDAVFSECESNAFFEKMYVAYYERIHRYFSFRLKNKSDADDLTQTVFLKVCSSLKKHIWNGAGGIYYIFIIARNTLIDYFRKHKHGLIISDELVQSVADTVTTEGPIEQRERCELLTVAMRELNDSETQAVTLRYFGDLEYRSIAEIMGKKEDAVRQLVHRGLKSLRLHMPLE